MTSTPSRTIVMNDASEGRAEPAGRLSLELGDQSLDLRLEEVEAGRERFAFESRRNIAAQPIELDFERTNRLRPATEQVTLERLEIRHVDRGQLGRRLVGPSCSAACSTRRKPRSSA